MSNLKFSKKSREILDTCHTDIQTVCYVALLRGVMDFSVISGHRTQEEQDALYPKFTQVKFPNSKHNALPSNAVDLYPYHPVYKSLTGHPVQLKEIALAEFPNEILEVGIEKAKAFISFEYGKLIGLVLGVASELGVELISGSDWDGDRDTFDHNFNDYPHFELRG